MATFQSNSPRPVAVSVTGASACAVANVAPSTCKNWSVVRFFRRTVTEATVKSSVAVPVSADTESMISPSPGEVIAKVGASASAAPPKSKKPERPVSTSLYRLLSLPASSPRSVMVRSTTPRPALLPGSHARAWPLDGSRAAICLRNTASSGKSVLGFFGPAGSLTSQSGAVGPSGPVPG